MNAVLLEAAAIAGVTVAAALRVGVARGGRTPARWWQALRHTGEHRR